MRRVQLSSQVSRALIAVLLAAMVMTGCALLESPAPTQSANESYSDLWTPTPGEQVIPGHEVPILNPGFWNDHYGPTVNPLLIQPVVAVIGPQGGTLTLGMNTLTVPPGAVDSAVTFRMSYGSLLGVAVDCGPSGLTFNVPCTLGLSYAGTQYQVLGDLNLLRVIYLSPEGILDVLPSLLNRSNRTVSAQINHFSRYILG